ncbi:MAG TPA: thioredoxin domain-containing protein [Candidatus Tectomicrobia bacterium]|nr:thioredoxin domain-containing protein [Candidatus Tectomicrobia bacterium]
MHSRDPRKSGPWRILLGFAAFWLMWNAAGAMAQPAVNQEATAPETYQGTPVGFTADGHPFRGNPDAPLTLVEYSDYLCPFCARYFSQTLPTLLEKYGRSGQVKFVMHDFPLAALHPTAPRGHAAARCVAEQGATPFWQMHQALLQAQQEWNRLPDPSAFLAKTARDARADMMAYEACMASGRQDTPVQRSVAAGRALGFNGTPSFHFVHQPTGKTYTLTGAQPVDVFTRWIEALLAGQEPPKIEEAQPAPAPKLELPFWAKPEGLAPDPKRPGYTVAGDAYKGNPEAKLVLVEFGDFQCDACQRHALTTQPELDKRFVETGGVRWVIKHFPLRAHPHAPVAAAAAECAGDQDKFWAMHHLLFERMEQWSTGNDPDTALVQLAADLEFDRAQFGACLQGRKALERVLRDLQDGQGIGVKNVPAFVLFQDETPFVLVGARPLESFARLLQQQLRQVKVGQ